MGTSYRKRKRLGPLPIWINISWSQTKGRTISWTFKLGPWSYNTGRNTSTFDLPGGWKHTHRHGQQQRSRG